MSVPSYPLDAAGRLPAAWLRGRRALWLVIDGGDEASAERLAAFVGEVAWLRRPPEDVDPTSVTATPTEVRAALEAGDRWSLTSTDDDRVVLRLDPEVVVVAGPEPDLEARFGRAASTLDDAAFDALAARLRDDAEGGARLDALVDARRYYVTWPGGVPGWDVPRTLADLAPTSVAARQLDLARALVAGERDAPAFERDFLELRREDDAVVFGVVGEVLDEIFYDLDAYVAEPELRDGPEDLDDDQLRERVRGQLARLERPPPGDPPPST